MIFMGFSVLLVWTNFFCVCVLYLNLKLCPAKISWLLLQSWPIRFVAILDHSESGETLFWHLPNTYFVLLLPLIWVAKVAVLSVPLGCSMSVLALERTAVTVVVGEKMSLLQWNGSVQLCSHHTIKEESLGAGKQRKSESRGLKSISD